MLCFYIDLLTVVCADVFCIPDIYVIIVVIFYFFLEPALIGLCPSDFQPPMANKYCVVLLSNRARGWALDRGANSRRPLDRLQYFALCDTVTLSFDILPLPRSFPRDQV